MIFAGLVSCIAVTVYSMTVIQQLLVMFLIKASFFQPRFELPRQ